jgi:hypothetical protein
MQKRISSISTPDLSLWVESLLPTIGKNVVHHQRDGEFALNEAEQAAEVTLAIVQELKRRFKDVG